jgi:hypothetical protein
VTVVVIVPRADRTAQRPRCWVVECHLSGPANLAHAHTPERQLCFTPQMLGHGQSPASVIASGAQRTARSSLQFTIPSAMRLIETPRKRTISAREVGHGQGHERRNAAERR